MDPGDPVNRAAFDKVQVVLLGPAETLFKTPIGTIERVGVKTDLDQD
jgi:hypothetical protein